MSEQKMSFGEAVERTPEPAVTEKSVPLVDLASNEDTKVVVAVIQQLNAKLEAGGDVKADLATFPQDIQDTLRKVFPQLWKEDGEIDTMALSTVAEIHKEALGQAGNVAAIRTANSLRPQHTDALMESFAKVIYRSQYPLVLVAEANDYRLADKQLINFLRGVINETTVAAADEARQYAEALVIKMKDRKYRRAASALVKQPEGDKTPHLKAHFFYAALITSAHWNGQKIDWLDEHFAAGLFHNDGTPKDFNPWDDVDEADRETCSKLIAWLREQFEGMVDAKPVSKKKRARRFG